MADRSSSPDEPRSPPGFASVLHQRSIKHRQFALDPSALRAGQPPIPPSTHEPSQPSARLKHDEPGSASDPFQSRQHDHHHHPQPFPQLHEQHEDQYQGGYQGQQHQALHQGLHQVQHHDRQQPPQRPHPLDPIHTRDLDFHHDEFRSNLVTPPQSASRWPPPSTASPRWDSLRHNRTAVSHSPTVPVSSARTPGGYQTPTGRGSPVNAMGRQPPSPFPGLSSHPVSPRGEVPSPSSTRPFPGLTSRDGSPHPPPTPTSAATQPHPLDTYQQQPADPNVQMGNFSRPRKPSAAAKQPQPDPPSQLRQGNALPVQPDSAMVEPSPSLRNNPSPTPSLPHSALPHSQRFSASSTTSANTFSSLPNFSSLPSRPSNDRLHSSYRTGSLRHPAPSAHSSRPPLSYGNGNSVSAAHHHHHPPRDLPPWLEAVHDEMQPTSRSQLTSYTTQGTLFTTSGTARSSVATRTSSVSESFIINGYARTSIPDEGLSIEDVMGMYANGFTDDTDEEDEAYSSTDAHVRASGSTGDVFPDVGVKFNDPWQFPPAKFEDDETDAGAFEASDVIGVIPEMGETEEEEEEGRQGRAEQAMETAADSVVSGLADFGYPIDQSEPLPEQSDAPGSPLDAAAVDPEQSLSEADEKRDSTNSSSEKLRSLSIVTTGRDRQLPQADDGVDSSAQSIETKVSSPGANDSTQASSTPPSSAAPSPHLPEEPPEEPGCRDRYGFRKENAYITREKYDAWNATYTEYLSRRRKKWTQYLKDSSLMTENPNRFPPRNNKTKRFVRKGIPPDWRGAAWFYYAGGPAILAKHSGEYEQMVKRAGLNSRGPGFIPGAETELKRLVMDDIEKDLHRTFPDNCKFKPPRYVDGYEPPSPIGNNRGSVSSPLSPNQPGPFDAPPPPEPETEPESISSLRRVLYAFALYNPRIGYCQSLNFLAGLLLLFVDTEEHAFWLLNVITTIYLPGTHETSLEGSKVDLGVFMAALKESLPQVWRQIGGDEAEGAAKPSRRMRGRRVKDVTSAMSTPKGGDGGNALAPNDPNRLPAITLCMTAWFMSCFIGTLPIETVLRVWDIFFYEGSRTLFRVALAIFKAGEAEIKAVVDPMEMFGVVQALPRRLLDCNTLLDGCYRWRNGIGHMSQESVDERREERRNGIRRWMADQDSAKDVTSPPPDPARVGTPAGLDLAPSLTDSEGDFRRGGTLFGRRRDRENKA